QETSYGFQSLSGYNYLLGSQKFSSGVRSLYTAFGSLFVALDNSLLIKVNGTGGTGANMFAVLEQGGTVTGLAGYNYWSGTQRFSGPVTSLIAGTDGTTLIGLSDGRMLKARGAVGTGQNMFAIQETSYGFQSLSGYNYL